MAIYVDDANICWNGMVLSHLVADDLDELHFLAMTIGLKKEWFQCKRYPHYDVCLEKKKLAIKLGAVEIESKDIIRILNNKPAKIQLTLF